MAYSQAFVIAGGIAHVPILITILRFFDGKSKGIHNAKEAAANKAKALEEAAKAKAKEAKAKADAKAKAEAEAKAAESSSNNESS